MGQRHNNGESARETTRADAGETEGEGVVMKKILLTLTAAGVLAVPMGVVLAQEDIDEPVEPVPTCEEHERNQDRDRLNEKGANAGNGRVRAEHQFRHGDGTDDGDCTGDQAQNRERVHTADGTGDQAKNRHGEMGNPGNGRGNG